MVDLINLDSHWDLSLALMMASMMVDQTNLVIHVAVMWATLKQKGSRTVAHLDFLTRKDSWMAVCLVNSMALKTE